MVFFVLGMAASAWSDSLKPVILEKTEAAPRFAEDTWEFSFENGQLFSVNNKNNYHMSVQMLTAHWQLDNVGNEGWLRGNTEWVVSGFYTQVLKGAENRFSGVMFGPRYNFVQEGWSWVPYLESRVGIAFTDSTAVDEAQGQDFCFTFMIGTGVRYIIDEKWSVSIAGMYQHISNGGLSEPARKNYGQDAIGPQIATLYRY